MGSVSASVVPAVAVAALLAPALAPAPPAGAAYIFLSLIFRRDLIRPIGSRNQPFGLEGGAHCEADGLAGLVAAQVFQIAIGGFVAALEQRAGRIDSASGARARHGVTTREPEKNPVTQKNE